ncbi:MULTISPECIES: DUF4387 domain-containing protein [Cupriavidus]|uniref:DUF4387 domain-containing protein n=1 Tax=Cupriavidus alkaliphilus TaxID=942866 RepID=A0A7W4VE77_9BURK|nr:MULTISPECIES: DUF4387 domain-containing protein [Cupriavidus]MBB3009949.1 hypothetical protein [Cupriavidus alkaliphilus]GLC96664.1 acyl-CoA synthetase [Cupriavidus sp. TA19]
MQLSDLAAMVRSKNAGPFVLTFDILFSDEESYLRVKRSGALNVEMFAKLYHTAPSKVRFFECDKALALKFSIPHPTTQGALGSADLHGGQQFIPLLAIQIP